MKNRLILLLLSLLGYGGSTSCSSRVMYDCPTPPSFRYYQVDIEGTVTDKDGHPIPAIVVRQDQKGTTLTDRNGAYRLSVGRSSTDGFPLTFTDMDGPDNGGDFDEKLIGIELTDADLVEKENEWTLGRYRRTADVVLEEKRPDEHEDAAE